MTLPVPLFQLFRTLLVTLAYYFCLLLGFHVRHACYNTPFALSSNALNSPYLSNPRRPLVLNDDPCPTFLQTSPGSRSLPRCQHRVSKYPRKGARMNMNCQLITHREYFAYVYLPRSRISRPGARSLAAYQTFPWLGPDTSWSVNARSIPHQAHHEQKCALHILPKQPCITVKY
ncbi:hypothetical protein V8F20_004384 [Naviculisporaceae sp. PSN 640]